MSSCLIIAGEKSGEEHALSFFNEIKKELPDMDFFGVGGDELKDAGMDLVYHLRDFSTWGISEAIKRIPFYLKAAKKIEEEVEKRNCKVCILIDFQTFNLKLAKRLKKKGVKILYYVAPQAWAWKAYRARVLEETVDTLFCILPFEKKWFMDRGVKKAISIEHPVYKNFKNQSDVFKRYEIDNFKSRKIKLLILPGSRNFEVSSLLPVFLKSVAEIKGFDFELSLVESSSVNEKLYLPYRHKFQKIYQNENVIEAIKEADMALAASGTVNIMCALFSLPTVVGYTGSLLNQFIYDTFVSYDGYISITNIVHQKKIYDELIGEKLSSYNVKNSLLNLLSPFIYNEKIKELSHTGKLLSGDLPDISKFLVGKINEAYSN